LQGRLVIRFIYVTHDQEEALTMSDRVVVMNGGRIEQIGRAEEIYERPLTEFVAGFIGVSNTIEGIVETVNGVSIIIVGNMKVSARTNVVKSGERVRVLVRPEKISISTVASPNAIAGKIDSVVYLGESTQWQISIDGGQAITVLEQNRQPFQSGESRIGQTVYLSWDPENAVILNG
jgi:ABC-type Fe3+/spermidine/putrescine transport system ATPase subunit